MSRKRYTPEQIIGMLREAEVRLSQGETVGVICRGLGVSEQSYYRRRCEYGGLRVDLISDYGRYGYRRVAALLRAQGWDVNVKRVWRIWRREGLKVPSKQPKRGRLWLNDGSCIRLRPSWPNHV